MTPPDRRLHIPATLAESIAGWEDDTADAWLDALPDRLDRLVARWGLDLGDPFEPGGVTAWVAPAATRDGDDAVLKVVVPHREALDEGPALAAWGGLGAPRLLDAAPEEHALLMERCRPGTPLGDLADPGQKVDIGAEVLSRLWRAPIDGHAFTPLIEITEWFARVIEDRRASLGDDIPLDPALVTAAVVHLRELPRTADRQVLLHHDLHPGNILWDDERGWLAIDPKPQVGDPAFDPVQLVLQSSDPLDEPDPGRTVRRRVERLSELLELDTDRLAAWGLARCVEWCLYDLAYRTRASAARQARRAALFASLLD